MLPDLWRFMRCLTRAGDRGFHLVPSGACSLPKHSLTVRFTMYSPTLLQNERKSLS